MNQSTPPDARAAKAFSTARARLILNHPFFGTLALRLHVAQDTSIPTLATNGRTMFYSPTFITSISDMQLQAEIAHEVMHCILDHIQRRGGRDPEGWNHACDYAVNPILKDAKFQLGADWLLDPQYFNMSAERIYNKMPKGGGAKNGQKPRDQILPAPPGSSSAYNSLDWKIATIQAANEVAKDAEAYGKLPAQIRQLIEEITNPVVDWRDQLREFPTQVNQADYSWQRPNKKYLPQIILPTLYSESMGPIDVVLDTSGSITSEILGEFGVEIRAIFESCRPERTRVIYADAAVNHVDIFEPDDDLHFEAHGGGGTDFVPAFDYVAEGDEPPACLLYLTDGYGQFPDTPPDFPVLWCMTSDVIPPFGDYIRIKE